ncbi:MAG: prolipoprotein diacylglyceryl transferase [Deltaproteobacteria bacterium]|nr:prolipoprotein diacylglyceryl transferase [Deltaproteobacteria bacterium]
MHPILFHIPGLGFKLHTYGFMTALGFLAGMFWVSYESKRLQLPTQKLIDLCFYLILATLFGARLFYMVIEVPEFWKTPLDFFKIWEGGLVFYGGLIVSLLFCFYYLKKNHLSFWKVTDVFSPGLAIGHALGRVGCFMAGCCHGKVADVHSFWAVIYPNDPESLAPIGIPIYATQLMESAAELLIFLILVFFRKKKKFDGEVSLLYLLLYSTARFFIEFLRGDDSRGFLLGLSSGQVVSFILFFSAIIFWFYRSKSFERITDK